MENSFSRDGDAMCAFWGPSHVSSFAHTTVAVKYSAEVYRRKTTLGAPRTTFYRWYDLYADGGLDGLADRSPCPGSVWHRIPDARRDDLIEFALEHEALSARELAVKYTDERRYIVSESSAYRIFKAADPSTAPDYLVIKAAGEFKDRTTAINEMPLSGSCCA